MKSILNKHYGSAILMVITLALGSQAQAAAVEASPANPSNKHIYIGQYDFHTNLWAIGGAGTGWYEYMYTNSPSGPSDSGWKWSGFGGDPSTVKSYPSIRKGGSNARNDPSQTGLPYQLGSNTRNVDVLWSFAPSGYDGTGSISGTYNHAIDVFFHDSTTFSKAGLKAELMIIPESSADSQTQGWGRKDATPFMIDGETWDVWQATMSSGGYSWPVMQFRKRVQVRYFNKNIQRFFAEAMLRRPDVFLGSHYVSMVEAGTEVKSGSGKVHNKRYSVNVY